MYRALAFTTWAPIPWGDCPYSQKHVGTMPSLGELTVLPQSPSWIYGEGSEEKGEMKGRERDKENREGRKEKGRGRDIIQMEGKKMRRERGREWKGGKGRMPPVIYKNGRL